MFVFRVLGKSNSLITWSFRSKVNVIVKIQGHLIFFVIIKTLSESCLLVRWLSYIFVTCRIKAQNLAWMILRIYWLILVWEPSWIFAYIAYIKTIQNGHHHSWKGPLCRTVWWNKNTELGMSGLKDLLIEMELLWIFT